MVRVPIAWPRWIGAATGPSKLARAASWGRSLRGIVTTTSCAATRFTLSSRPIQTGASSIGWPALNRV